MFSGDTVFSFPEMMKGETVENNLIVIKQLPVIEDQLVAVKQSIEVRVNEALSLICTEDTYKDIKRVRSELNKEFQELEKRRKEVKAQILKPYESFEGIYRECAGDLYAMADEQLKKKIGEVEDGLRKQKEDDLISYFAEHRAEAKIPEDFVTLEAAGIKVGLSDSKTALHKKVDEFLDRIASDLQVIETLESRDEVLTEYKDGHNLSAAMLKVENRHRAIEAERIRREEMQAKKAAEEAERKAREEAEKAAAEATEGVEAAWEAAKANADTPMEHESTEPAPAEAKAVSKMYTVLLRITTTKDGMNQLKDFMESANIAFERVKGE